MTSGDTPQPLPEVLAFYARGLEDERLSREEGLLERLLEAKANLQRMMTQRPLTDDERAAVEDRSPRAIDRMSGERTHTSEPYPFSLAESPNFIPLGGPLDLDPTRQRMLAQISLTDDERAAVEDGSAAVERLVARLASMPTPMGRTPHALAQFADLVALSSLQVSVQAPPTTQQENA